MHPKIRIGASWVWRADGRRTGINERLRFTPEFRTKVDLDVLTRAQSLSEARCKHALSPNLQILWKSAFRKRAHTPFQPDEQRDVDQARIDVLEQLPGRTT